MPVNTIGLAAEQNKNSPKTLRGDRNPVVPWDGNRNVNGSIVVPVDYTAFWYWLKAMFGDPATTGGSDPYTHKFTVHDEQESLVLDKGFTDITKYWKYNGCKINRWSMHLDAARAEELVATFDVLGADETLGTSPLDAAPNSLTLGRLDNFEASLTEGGGAIANVKTLSFSVDFGLDPDCYVIGGSGIRGDLPEGVMAVTGNMLALFENHTLADKAAASTETSIGIEIMTGTHGLKIYFDELQYARPKTLVEGPQGILISLDWAAYYDDDADASSIWVQCINADAHA